MCGTAALIPRRDGCGGTDGYLTIRGAPYTYLPLVWILCSTLIKRGGAFQGRGTALGEVERSGWLGDRWRGLPPTPSSLAPRRPTRATPRTAVQSFIESTCCPIRGMVVSNSNALLRIQANRSTGVQAGLPSESGVRSSGSKLWPPGQQFQNCYRTPGLSSPVWKVTPGGNSAFLCGRTGQHPWVVSGRGHHWTPGRNLRLLSQHFLGNTT